VKFYVNKEGKIINPKVITTSGDKNVDQILIETISNMPNWNPAKDSNGVAVQQEFELHVGKMIGC
jgi:outer membrane biosynthesis protein TonB